MTPPKITFKISHLIFMFIVGAFLLPSLILSAFVLKTQALGQRLKEQASDQVLSAFTEQVLAVETKLDAGMVRIAYEAFRRGSVAASDRPSDELLVAGFVKDDGGVEIFYNQDPDAPYLERQSVLAALGPLSAPDGPGDHIVLGVKTGVPPAYFRKFNLVTTSTGSTRLFGVVDNMALSNQLARALEPLDTGGYVAVLSGAGDIVYAPERVRYRVDAKTYESHSSGPQDGGLTEDFTVRTSTLARQAPGTTVLHLTERRAANVEATKTVLVIIFSMVLSLILGVIAAQAIRGSIAMPLERLSETFRRTGVGLAERAEVASKNEDPYPALQRSLVSVRAGQSNVREIADLLHGTAALAERLAEFQAKVVENAKYQAVALATQMLAHDVRKPFSKMRMGLNSLKAAGSWDAAKNLVARLTPEVEAALASVQGLLEDVMESSATVVASREKASPIALIDASLRETVLVSQKHGVAFRYELAHRQAVEVAPLKIARLFHNIIENALHATQGEIWIATHDEVDQGRAVVRFRIGNAGSYIEPEDREQVFKAFFTKGKSRGTGLGLPIALKIVEGHGGRIWCTSSREAGTEFHFTLPAGTAAEDRSAHGLPASSDAILDQPSEPRAKKRDMDHRLAGVATELLRAVGRTLRILVVDDDAGYARDVAALIAASEIGGQLAVEVLCRDFEDAAAILARAPDIVVCDIDFGLEGYNGLDLTRRLRQAAGRPFLCVHSNRVSAQDARAAYDAGADIFLRKPFTEAALCDLFGAMRALRKAGPEPAAGTAPAPIVAVVDDDPFVCEAWTEALAPAAQVRTFLSPEAFLAAWARQEEWGGEVAAIVVDYYFDRASRYDGASLAQELVRGGLRVPIVLASDAELPAAEARVFRAVVGKQPMSFAELMRRLG